MKTHTQAIIESCPLTHAVILDSGYEMDVYHNSTHIKAFPHLAHYGKSEIDGKRIGAREMAAAYAIVEMKLKVFHVQELTSGDSSMYDAVALTRKQQEAPMHVS